jgi:DNA-binding FadR family transcriptional regulator
MPKNIEIAPVQRAQLTEQVIERIKEYIEANDLRPGAKLPGERELSQSLGVSRNVTREAIRALQATGILDIQPGNGIFVAEFGFEALANHFNFVIRSQQHQLQFLV